MWCVRFSDEQQLVCYHQATTAAEKQLARISTSCGLPLGCPARITGRICSATQHNTSGQQLDSGKPELLHEAEAAAVRQQANTWNNTSSETIKGAQSQTAPKKNTKIQLDKQTQHHAVSQQQHTTQKPKKPTQNKKENNSDKTQNSHK